MGPVGRRVFRKGVRLGAPSHQSGRLKKKGRGKIPIVEKSQVTQLMSSPKGGVRDREGAIDTVPNKKKVGIRGGREWENKRVCSF